MTTPKRLYLIDGMALIYRAHFAMINNPLITQDGRHTSAIYGVVNSLLKLIREENPDYFAFILDCKEPTFRHKLYTEYKATREKMPEELVEQLNPLFKIIEQMNIPMVKKPGFEADDIIGTLSRQAESAGLDTIIVTGDKDMMQLVTEHVFVYSPGNRFKPTTIYNPKKVKDRWGIEPIKIIDYLAMVGDSSDNIPGVDGIGAKTAVKLLLEYGNMETIIDHTEEIKNKRVYNGLKNGHDLAHLSKELVTIDCDVPIELHLEELVKQDMDIVSLNDTMNDLELHSLIKQINNQPLKSEEIKPVKKVKKSYKTITEVKELKELVDILASSSLISVDLETTSVVPHEAEIVGVSFSNKENKGWYIPVEYPEKLPDMFSPFNLENILELLKPILENATIAKCGQNIKYDALVFHNYNIQLQGIKFDSMVAGHMLQPNRNSLKLDHLSLDYLQYKMKPIEELIGKGAKQISMAEVPLKDIAFYANEDADIAYSLTQVLKKDLEEKNLIEAFEMIEVPLIPVLIEIEKNGVFVDLDFLKNFSDKLEVKLNTIVESIYDMVEHEFNINSPQQLAEVLFDELGLKPIKKRSTAVEVLEVLKYHHPLPEKILEYRQVKKLKSTYVDAFPNHVNPRTGRIHTSLNQTIASTGRLSSTRPNFQNIPIRTELGKEIRKAFIAEKQGCKILSADYSQVELRIMAHFSGEPELLKAFTDGVDIHRRTASLVNGISEDEVTPDQRRSAKVVNFGIMYGAGPFRMSQELGISMTDARKLIDNYFKTYPGIKQYMENTLKDARDNGYVKTLSGRRRNTQNLMVSNKNIVQAEERATINMPIQGTAADLIKIAMIRIQNKLIEQQLETKMILQIHDELLFEVPEHEVDQVSKMVVYEMENAMDLDVPLIVDWNIGDNWYEAH